MIERLKKLLNDSSDNSVYYQLALLDSVDDAIISTDNNYKIQTWNSAAEEIHGFSAAETIGKDIRTLLQYHYVNDTREKAMAKLLKDGKWKGIVRFDRVDGKKYYLQSSFSLVLDPQGKMIGFEGINRDITEDYINRQTLSNLVSVLSQMEENFFILNNSLQLTYLSARAFENAKTNFGFQFKLDDNFLTQFPSSYRNELKSILSTAMQGQKIRRPISMTGIHRRFYGYLQVIPIKENDGIIKSICLVVRDTTESVLQKKASKEKMQTEEQLFQSRQMFEAFMQNAPLISWITREDGIMEYMNPLYYKALNFTQKEIGKSIFDIFPREIAESYYSNNLEVIKNGKPVEAIEKVHYPNGDIGTLKIYKFPLIINGFRMVGGWAVDISELINLQNKLVASNERYEYVAQATSDAIYDWDLLTQNIYRGNGFKILFGYTSPTTSIRFRLSRIHPDDYEKIKNNIFSSLRQMKHTWQLEYRFMNSSGEYRYVLDKAHIINNGSKVVRVIGAIQDITQQIHVQQLLTEKEKNKKTEIVNSIIETQENERRQLSVLLRDNINQTLTSTKLLLDMATSDQEKAPYYLKKGREGIMDVISEVNKLSKELNPSAIDDLNLEEALKLLILNYQTYFPIKLIVKGIRQLNKLTKGQELAIYRIIQDYLELYYKDGGQQQFSVEISAKSSLYKIHLRYAATQNNLTNNNINHRIENLSGIITVKKIDMFVSITVDFPVRS